MPEPTSAAVATIVAQAAAVPVLTFMGVGLGLRPDVLLAGFCGSVAAMSLLNTVPGSTDNWRELWKTSYRRVSVAIASSLFAGYATPLLALMNGVPPALLLSVAFIAGAGAQTLLAKIVSKAKTSTPGANPDPDTVAP